MPRDAGHLRARHPQPDELRAARAALEPQVPPLALPTLAPETCRSQQREGLRAVSACARASAWPLAVLTRPQDARGVFEERSWRCVGTWHQPDQQAGRRAQTERQICRSRGPINLEPCVRDMGRGVGAAGHKLAAHPTACGDTSECTWGGTLRHARPRIDAPLEFVPTCLQSHPANPRKETLSHDTPSGIMRLHDPPSKTRERRCSNSDDLRCRAAASG